MVFILVKTILQMKDKVSIIIPTWNGLDFLKPCMESIQTNTDWPFEVIVVDNGSKDGTQDWVLNADFEMDGQFIKNDTNEGFAKANNKAVGVAKGSFICLLNNDTLVTKGWLTEMMNVFSEEQAVGAVGARLVHPGKGTIQHAGVIELSSGVPDHVHFGLPMDHPKVIERKQYFGVTGACLLTPKQLYREMGGLDEAFINGWEDMDYMQKLHKAGYRVYYEPKALVYHYESRTKGRYANENANFSLYMSRWVYGKQSKQVDSA
jgi:O-antigen biosynthesis protein